MVDRVFDPCVLAHFVCPVSRGRLRFDAATNEVVSDDAGLAYPIRKGIAVLVADQARHIPVGVGGCNEKAGDGK